ncbi:hypothetical protein DFS33DRAFT_1472716 [Desarmillaria ectypa]|nr:hypothetical protein DFS33DRAFT_1472716 [Desarmillaria ectypa]
MVLHPQIFKKVQSKIDTVIGSGQLPSFEDMDSLTYLQVYQYICCVSLPYNWGGAKTLAIPHKLMRDDMYEGYLLPGGATVAPNV